jgi:nucleotide-binding universal stress UspA family protein
MNTIDRILVATSFSERSADAVRKAAVLASERHASLTLLHVVEPVKNRRLRRLVKQEMLVSARATDARAKLARLAGEIAALQGVPVEICVRVGDKLAAIRAACREADVLFIGGTAGRAAPFRRPTADRLLGRCDVPIVVVNGPQSLQCTRALVVVRDAPGGVSALKATSSLWPAAEKVVLYAVDPRQQQPKQISEASTSAEGASRARGARIRRYLRSLVRRAGLEDVSCRYGYGDACKVALSMQAEVRADVMVLTRRRDPEVETFVLGRMAARLLAIAQCDVLITAAAPSDPIALALPAPKLAA